MITVLIIAIVALVLITGILAFIIYNQMLLVNQVNKRLLVMTKESIEKERMTMEELQDVLDHFEPESAEGTIAPKATPQEDDEPFDPHTFDPTDLE